MDVVFGTPTRCAGGEHILLTGTLEGQAFHFHTSLDEIKEAPKDPRVAVIMAARGLILDAGAATWVQARNAIAGQTRRV